MTANAGTNLILKVYNKFFKKLTIKNLNKSYKVKKTIKNKLYSNKTKKSRLINKEKF